MGPVLQHRATSPRNRNGDTDDQIHLTRQCHRGTDADTTALDEVRQGNDWVTRRVGANGVVSIAWQQISVGKHRNGHNVDVHIQNEMVQIWDGAELIKSALRNRPGEVIRKKNAETTRRK